MLRRFGILLLGVVTLVGSALFLPLQLHHSSKGETASRVPRAIPVSPLRASATFIASTPGVWLASILPSGPVAGASDATARAVLAANDSARGDWGVEPFARSKSTATFDGQRWLWHKRVGYGTGDFEAEVEIGPNGTIERVTIQYITQRI